jgi:DNA-binding IclR family transcriptional regulator
VLRVLIAAAQPMVLGDIAVAVKLDQSTTMRLLRTLEDAGHVLRTNGGKRYLASPKALFPLPLLHPLALFRREAQPTIERLANIIKQTVVLVLFEENQRIAIDIAQAPGSLAPYYSPWLGGALHCSGSGKILLMSREVNARRELLGPDPLPPSTPVSPPTLEAVNRDLEAAAARGYVISRDEFRMGQTSIAAPFDSWGTPAVGCLVVTGLTRDLDEERIETIAAELTSAAMLLPYQATSLRSAVQYLGGGAA